MTYDTGARLRSLYELQGGVGEIFSNKVTAIEPNIGMRAAADQALAHIPLYSSADGSAERIPLPASSLDLITAAQAFHWFEIEAARAEFLRALKPQDTVALFWNDRVLTDPLHVALNDVFAQYGGAKRSALVTHEERGDVARFFGSCTPVSLTWPHEHHIDEAALLSLVFSRSYMPDRDSEPGQQASAQVRAVFLRLATQEQLVVRYTTLAIVGRPQ